MGRRALDLKSMRRFKLLGRQFGLGLGSVTIGVCTGPANLHEIGSPQNGGGSSITGAHGDGRSGKWETLAQRFAAKKAHSTEVQSTISPLGDMAQRRPTAEDLRQGGVACRLFADAVWYRADEMKLRVQRSKIVMGEDAAVVTLEVYHPSARLFARFKSRVKKEWPRSKWQHGTITHSFCYKSMTESTGESEPEEEEEERRIECPWQ